MSKPFVQTCALLLLAAIIFSINVGGYDLWPPDEPRYALVAREMMDSGDYLAPRVNGQPYKEKPPLLFWAIAAVSAWTGDVTALSARIPSVLAGLITLIFTGLLARELFSARIAFWSILILMTMQRFWWNSRFGQIDMLLTACLTVGLYAFWRWENTRRYVWLTLFYLAALAGLYAKGPGVLVFPVLFVLVWTWHSERRKEAWIHLFVGCLLCIVAYAAWAIPVHVIFAGEAKEAAGDVLASNLFRQTLGRFFLGVSHANWPWYYLTTLPVDWLPWTLFLPWVALWTWKHRRESASVRFLLCWTLPAFLFFSAAIGKRGVYLLPLFPAFSMLFAHGVLDFMQNGQAKWQRRIGILYALILLVIGLAPSMLLFTEYGEIWSPALTAVGVVIAVYGLLMLFYVARKATTYLHIHIPVSFVFLALFCSLFALPAINIHKSARDFCGPIAGLVAEGLDFDLYSVGFAREEYIFYSRHFFKELYTEGIPLQQSHDMTEMQMVKFQKDLSRAIGKSVEDIAVKDIKNITAEELERLRAAIRETVGKKNYPPALVEDFKDGLEKESDAFFSVFTSERPAFLYVQDYDWLWIYAFHPDLQGAVVLDRRNVGSRSVLLVANPAGAALLRSKAPSQSD